MAKKAKGKPKATGKPQRDSKNHAKIDRTCTEILAAGNCGGRTPVRSGFHPI
jgi:hypothetical protein